MIKTKVQAGGLRRRVTIQQQTKARTGSGAEQQTWSDFLPCWASIEGLRGSEAVSAKTMNAEADTTIKIRYQRGINPKMRVKFLDVDQGKTRYFDILVAINLHEEQRMLDLICVERYL